VAGVVAEIVFAAFVPALRGDFVSWDDETNFVLNQRYRGLGPAQLRWMLTTMEGHYMPLTWLSLGFDYVVWGMRPAGYHLTSLVLHALAGAAAYVVALRLFAVAVGPVPRWALRIAAAVSALLFAVHPLRVESVAWITERRDVLCGLFFLLAVALYLRAAAGGPRRVYWASVAMAALALLCKAIAVPLPVVLVVLDVYPLRRLGPGQWTTASARRVWLEKVPFAALSLGAAVVALVAQRSIGNLTTLELGWPARLAISAYALVFYAWKTVAPTGLAPLYELPFRVDALAPSYVASAVAVVAAATALWLGRRRAPAATAAAAAFAALLLPMLGIVHFGPHLAADRNTYLAGLAPAMLVGGWALHLWRGRRGAVGHAVAGACVVLVAVLAVLTWRQSGIWHDSETLWRHALRTSPSAIAHVKLGMLLEDAGQPQAAIEHHREAVRLHPDLAVAYNNWGIALGHLERFDEAMEKFQLALRIRPNYREAQHNLAITRLRAAEPALQREMAGAPGPARPR
jgi:protein O-mannosyl-transferase